MTELTSVLSHDDIPIHGTQAHVCVVGIGDKGVRLNPIWVTSIGALDKIAKSMKLIQHRLSVASGGFSKVQLLAERGIKGVRWQLLPW